MSMQRSLPKSPLRLVVAALILAIAAGKDEEGERPTASPTYPPTVYSCSIDELSYVTGPMAVADADGSGFLSPAEYLEFTNAVSGGLLTEQGRDGSFDIMPPLLKQTYLVLSCLCGQFKNQAWGGTGCCVVGNEAEVGIRTVGTDPAGPGPTRQEHLYLKHVCSAMAQTLAAVGGELMAPPTRRPTASPTYPMASAVGGELMAPPTRSPTGGELMAPPTRSPTAPPTYPMASAVGGELMAPPTRSPTASPAYPPTEDPTRGVAAARGGRRDGGKRRAGRRAERRGGAATEARQDARPAATRQREGSREER